MTDTLSPGAPKPGATEAAGSGRENAPRPWVKAIRERDGVSRAAAIIEGAAGG